LGHEALHGIRSPRPVTAPLVDCDSGPDKGIVVTETRTPNIPSKTDPSARQLPVAARTSGPVLQHAGRV